jgi:hypothetical protein
MRHAMLAMTGYILHVLFDSRPCRFRVAIQPVLCCSGTGDVWGARLRSLIGTQTPGDWHCGISVASGTPGTPGTPITVIHGFLHATLWYLDGCLEVCLNALALWSLQLNHPFLHSFIQTMICLSYSLFSHLAEIRSHVRASHHLIVANHGPQFAQPSQRVCMCSS